MSQTTETPPGLEALANHLGYTFVRKESSSSASSVVDESTAKVDKPDASSVKKDENQEAKEDATKSNVRPGSLTSSANIYRGSPDDSWTAKQPEDTEPAEGKDTIGHAVVLRQQKSKDSRKGYEIHSIVIQSQALKTALADILDGYPGVYCNLDRLVFKAPFAPFIHRWGAILKYLENDRLDQVTRDHTTLLRDILQKECAETIKALENYVDHGVVTYEHAWTIFQPDAVVVSSTGIEEQIAFRLKSGSYQETDEGNFFNLKCQSVDWNGKSFGWVTESVKLPEFEGIQRIAELCILPLDFHPKKEYLKHALTERGKRFAALSGYHYRSYDGPAIERTDDGNILVHNKGRIIIDTDSFCKQPYQCKVYTAPLNSKLNTALSLKKESGVGPAKLTDYQCMLCTPILRGYSLTVKKWLSFYVDYVQSIKWNTEAFDNLVLPAAQKKLVLALSKTQAATANDFDDVIAGKGKGMILLLSGPPGVGKTLTAEAVSENMKVPLYMLSAGDLGTSPNDVEYNLNNVLEIVAKWKAILLIDECDVFLEARSVHDLARNRLVSIFLRLLEYYKGTLFLTTNRVDNIDAAFQSRIHVHMKYANLTSRSRRRIWSTFVGQTGSRFEAEELDQLAEVPLNGRQIKNLVKTAQLLALEDRNSLTKDHIDMVLAIEKGFGEDEQED
ncbi:P-loop containing nucleoside triphosphate hydrolase protein [Paraphaeosphaeria sporulosa]|uniref:p-loop containing nucleoside triphosphate hydrolase protein n=1 Tax=Paraphaeosphaeria sporulosa TaxID=1460663 RepID=A0A177CJY4_9PLEO|nr:P-loop containing nucleoside triphosphate hydrolase protein [Paraphaeosphaeria sporulosa]OAG07282.1 P-loop containing nucleoside triphosphate hydrolase protein [Paraphaeosphaeria sporulosa]